jgi:type I restriction enzyme S subunit
MTDWPVKTLGDLLEVSIGGIWGSEAGEDEVDVFVYRSTELIKDGQLREELTVRRSITARQLDSRKLEEGDLLLEKSGGGPKTPVGRVGLVKVLSGLSVCSNFMQLMRPRKKDVLPVYLHYFLNHFHVAGHTEDLQNNSTNIRNLKTTEYMEVEIPLPPVEEQKRLVALLDAATACVTELAACYEQARTHANNLFASELTEIFEKCAVDTSAKQLSIREICKIGDGNHSAKYPKSSEFVVKGVPFIRANNISNGKISVVDMRYISEKKHFELKKGHLRDGDVLITNRGEIGSLAIVGSEFDGANLNSQIAWLRVSALVTNRYLYYFLCSQNAKAQFFQGTTGAALQQLTISQLREIRVPIVPLTTQQTVIDHLDKLKSKSSEMVAAYDAKLTAAKNLRQSILEAAFTGQL